MAFISVNGIELRYLSSGAGETIIFLHGLGSCVEDWDFQVDYFSQFFHVVAVDMRGHGLSAKPRGKYTIEQMANDIAELMQKLDLKSAHCIGLSLGAMVLLQLALDRPELIKSMVIVNATPKVDRSTFRKKRLIAIRFFIVRVLGLNVAGKILAKKLFPHPEQIQRRKKFLKYWLRNRKHAYLSVARAIINWDISDELHKINIATLVVSGEFDYTSVEVKKKYMRCIKNARLEVVKNSGHATPADQPEYFNKIVKKFIRGR